MQQCPAPSAPCGPGRRWRCGCCIRACHTYPMLLLQAKTAAQTCAISNVGSTAKHAAYVSINNSLCTAQQSYNASTELKLLLTAGDEKRWLALVICSATAAAVRIVAFHVSVPCSVTAATAGSKQSITSLRPPPLTVQHVSDSHWQPAGTVQQQDDGRCSNKLRAHMGCSHTAVAGFAMRCLSSRCCRY